MDAETTRRALVDSATRLFSEHGIGSVPLSRITAAAGQRNASALQYHFKSRTGLLCAILAVYIPRIRDRRRALLAEADDRPLDTVAYARAFVLPQAEFLTGDDPLGRAFLRVNAELHTDLHRHAPEVRAALELDVVRDVFDRLWRAHDVLTGTAAVPTALRPERTRVGAMMILHALADQARLCETEGAPIPPDDAFADNLVDMFLGATLSPARPRQGLSSSPRSDRS